jgi:hypothetical protein
MITVAGVGVLLCGYIIKYFNLSTSFCDKLGLIDSWEPGLSRNVCNNEINPAKFD